MKGIDSISAREAATLVARGDVLVLDVRTPGEFADLGHIPGAWLLPVDLIAAAPAVLPTDERTVIVCCEHGVRSVAATRWLVAAGCSSVVNMAGGMSQWTGPRSFGADVVRGPAGWLVGNADLLPRSGRVLDLASGRGRHALLMAAAGFQVRAVDRDEAAVGRLNDIAGRLGLSLDAQVVDLERGQPTLGDQAFDIVLVFNYLHRPLMPAVIEAVAPGGVLVYETFTVGQAERGHPKNPAFLLEPGELPRLVAPLIVERSREGEVDGRLVASVVARRHL